MTDPNAHSEPSALSPVSAAPLPSPATGRPSSRRRGPARWIGLLILLLGMGAGGAWYWKKQGSTAPEGATEGAQQGAPGAGGRRFGAGSRPQPVSAQVARRQDLRVSVNAIGTITALNTATVRARVDGELRRILFTEGQQVKAGDLLAEIDPRAYEVALAQMQGQLQRDAAQLKNAELDLARYRDLLAKDSIAKQQVDTQEALVGQLKGTVQSDQAQVDNARLQLSYTRVTAPISGRLGLRQVDLGNIVHASDTTGLVTITQTQPIAVVFAVPEAYLPQITRRLQAKGSVLAVEAWDREQRKRLAQGRVLTTDNAIDTTTGTIKLKAEFPNADGTLFPNQFVNIRLQLDTLPNALVAPNNAIQRGSMGTFVYLVKEDGSVTLRKVTTGAVDGDWVAIEGEIESGDRLVTDGADRLREGAKVEVIESKRGSRPGAGAAAGGAAAAGASKGSAESAPGKAAAPAAKADAAPAKGEAASAPAATPTASAGASPGAGAGAEGEARPRWMDALPPELVEKLKAMPPEERRAYLQKLRERRQQRESGG